MTAPPEYPRRVVVRSPNWLGDAVLALPAMAAIRAHFADAHLTIAAPASIASLFRETTAAAPDAVLELGEKDRDVRAALRAGQFNLCVLFPNSFRSAWQARRSGIRERWGYATSARRWLLTLASKPPKRSGVSHQMDYYSDLVSGLGIAVATEKGDRILEPSAVSAAQAELLLGRHGLGGNARLVALQPGAAYGQAKQWPPDRMAQVAARLSEDHNLHCVLLGAPHDRLAARAIESWLRANAPAVRTRVIDLVGRTSLGALVAVLDRSMVSISNDSGGMHLAAALGRPVVAIFGPTDERVTSPVGRHDVLVEKVFCRPCMLRDCPIDHRCMKRISVERVTEAASRHIVARPD